MSQKTSQQSANSEPTQSTQSSQSSSSIGQSPQIKRRSDGQSPAPIRRNESPVWQYYKRTNTETRCTVENCTKTYSINTATTSLIVHLENVHKIICIVKDDDISSNLEVYSNEEVENSDDKRPRISQGAHYGINTKKKADLDKLFLVSITTNLIKK